MLQLGWLESHSPPALPCSVHGPAGLVGHDMAGHDTDGLLQSTSHWQDAAQSISGHANAPEHRIAHSPLPQLMLPHAAEPEQLMSQLCACAQSTVPHAPPLLHRIVQS
jgi:hypothetical protein